MHGATVVSHGCTGKGNDQVRFEVGIANLAPHLKVIAPVRDYAWTREKAIAYAESRGPADRGQQEVAVLDRPERLGPGGGDRLPGGHLERPDRGRLRLHRRPGVPREPDEVVITFEAGVPIAIDGEKVSMLEAIQQLNERAGAQGVGRLDMVEDRLVGIKSREVYEAPGAIALITAHMELENVTVERELARFKRGRRPAVGRAGLRRAVVLPAEAGAGRLHRRGPAGGVAGTIRMVLHGGRATVTGRQSDVSLYDFNLATYDEGDTFDQSQARGFIEIYGMSSKLAARRDAGLL